MLIIPIEPGVPFQSFLITLADNQYTLSFRWNGRAEIWSMDVLTPQETPIAFGLKLLGGAIIGSTAVFNTEFPDGTFVLFDTTETNTDPDLDSLGSTVELIFVGLAEIDLTGFPTRAVATPTNGPDIEVPEVKPPVDIIRTGLVPEGTFDPGTTEGEVLTINPFGYVHFS